AHPTINTAAYAITVNPTRVWGTKDARGCALNGSSSCWKDLTGNLPSSITAMDLAVDPVSPGALYLATTAGVYKSVSNGTRWGRWTTGLPARGSQSVWRLQTVDKRPSGGQFSVYAGIWGGGIWSRNGAEH
ncbi:MAG: hypothetical protein M3O46_07795, partial [Myxococcota bacterium]|nr:hypothetical protein [Myxococcota bacterium]